LSPKKTADAEKDDEDLDYEEFEGKEQETLNEVGGDDSSVSGIEVTDLPGVGPAIGKRLAESGYKSVEAIAVASPGELAAAGSISKQLARCWILVLRPLIFFLRDERRLVEFQLGQRL
jgi:predicted flap endonuclease-1-like 5' DNA nuclease